MKQWSLLWLTGIGILGLLLRQFVPGFTADTFTIACLLIAAAPWLAELFESIKIGDIELKTLQKEVAEARGAAESAMRQSDLAVAQTQPTPARQEAVEGPRAEVGADDLAQLAARYEKIRADHPSGRERTVLMTALVGEILTAVTERPDLDPRPFLESRIGGERLVGYVFAHAHPRRVAAPLVLDALTTRENKPFGQYWALRALRRVLDPAVRGPAALGADECARLRRYGSTLTPGTDRHYEYLQLMRESGCERI
jgi:hypothetical protein